MGARDLGRRSAAALGLTLWLAAPAAAQLFPATLPAHVIVDSCSGCSGSGVVAQGAAGAAPWLVSDGNLDIALSALRDALRGANAKTLTDVVNALGSLTVAISGSVTVTGPLTDAQLRASAVPVSLATAPSTPVTGTFWQSTQPVSLAQDVATSANQATELASLALIAAPLNQTALLLPCNALRKRMCR